ncbi:hypothetical protein JIG36_16760 [Actinoplanes sp. LDG1-06]|uniref:Uncharacterized protein n=1 Tax=Paractinoplanes ovalisporus TaxID=2810368 RepID=A0ABS2ABJ6_9ACTN|nr:hypothetical protein [Actinoplanes ovalisporus]MBM2617206.1 hypothetical protein [Actinoplanes ovalisporus]
MPDRESVAGNARLLRGLIWAGVLLAPLAAAVVLLGQSSNSVRFAMLLLAVAIVAIGASVLVRSDPVLGRMDVEERVAEEVATLRRELRAEFGRGGPPHQAPPPPMPMPAHVPAPAMMRQQPEEEPSGFFSDLPAEGQYPDPFANDYVEDDYPQNDYPADDYAPQPPPMPAGPPPMGSPRPPAGGRAGVPVASAAVRPPSRTGPGLTTGGRPINPPGSSTGGRAVASAAASVPPPPPPQVPRQRGAAPIPPPAPPRASASVRPAGAYGHQPDSLAEDFGASTGYAAQGPGVYGAPAGGGAYGTPTGGTYGGGGNDFDSDEYNGYGAPNYGGSDQGDYGYSDEPDYGPPPREPGTTTGDPHYKARRHRPSANDTNVGSLSDFAQYNGYSPDPGHRRP